MGIEPSISDISTGHKMAELVSDCRLVCSSFLPHAEITAEWFASFPQVECRSGTLN